MTALPEDQRRQAIGGIEAAQGILLHTCRECLAGSRREVTDRIDAALVELNQAIDELRDMPPPFEAELGAAQMRRMG